MDALYSTSSAPAYDGWGHDSQKHLREISRAIQSHLKLVYLTLYLALVSLVVGAYLHTALNIGTILTMLGCMGSIAWLFSVLGYEEEQRKRKGFDWNSDQAHQRL